MNVQSFSNRVTHSHSWIERSVGVLENHLQPAPSFSHFGVRHGGDVSAFEKNFAIGRMDEPHDRPAEGAFAASAFTNEPDGLARSESERDSIHGVDVFLGAAKDAFTNGKMDLDILNFEQVHRSLRFRWETAKGRENSRLWGFISSGWVIPRGLFHSSVLGLIRR